MATSKTLSSKHLDASKTAISQLPAGIKTSVATGDELVSGMVVGAYKYVHISPKKVGSQATLTT